LSNLDVKRSQKIRSEEFDHIIHDKETELSFIFFARVKYWRQDYINKLVNQISAQGTMSLEQDSNDLSNRVLEIIFVVVFFFDDFKIIFVKLLIFILCLSLILGKLIIFLDSLIRFIVLLYQELRQTKNSFLVQKASVLTCFIYDFFSRLYLADKAICLSFLFDSLKQLFEEDSCHLKNLWHSRRVSTFHTLKETWKSSCN